MSETEKKGITVKIDADLHAQVRQYIEANGMTMAAKNTFMKCTP